MEIDNICSALAISEKNTAWHRQTGLYLAINQQIGIMARNVITGEVFKRIFQSWQPCVSIALSIVIKQ